MKFIYSYIYFISYHIIHFFSLYYVFFIFHIFPLPSHSTLLRCTCIKVQAQFNISERDQQWRELNTWYMTYGAVSVLFSFTHPRTGRRWTGGTRRGSEPVPPPPLLPAPVWTSRSERTQRQIITLWGHRYKRKVRLTAVNMTTASLVTLVNWWSCYWTISDTSKSLMWWVQCLDRKGCAANRSVMMKGNTCIIKISFIWCSECGSVRKGCVWGLKSCFLQQRGRFISHTQIFSCYFPTCC